MPKSKSKILVIEDDQFLLKVYKNKLEEEGFEVALAVDGIEGFSKAKENKPELILLDLILPKKTGFEVLEDLKNDEATKGIPVMILSNLGQESDIEKGINMGAVDYIVKANYSINEVVARVKEQLARGGSAAKQAAKDAKKIKCPSCGEEAVEGSKFCPECGQKI